MKASQVTACFFAAFGVYLVVTSMVAAVAAIFALVQFTRYAGDDTWILSAIQMAMPFLPMIIGVVLVLSSRTLGRMASRRALTEDLVLQSSLSAYDVTRVLLIGVGAYVVVTEVPRVAHAAILIFQVRAGSREIGFQAGQQIPDLPSLIAAVVTVVLGCILCQRSESIARRRLARE